MDWDENTLNWNLLISLESYFCLFYRGMRVNAIQSGKTHTEKRRKLESFIYLKLFGSGTLAEDMHVEKSCALEWTGLGWSSPLERRSLGWVWEDEGGDMEEVGWSTAGKQVNPWTLGLMKGFLSDEWLKRSNDLVLVGCCEGMAITWCRRFSQFELTPRFQVPFFRYWFAKKQKVLRILSHCPICTLHWCFP